MLTDEGCYQHKTYPAAANGGDLTTFHMGANPADHRFDFGKLGHRELTFREAMSDRMNRGLKGEPRFFQRTGFR